MALDSVVRHWLSHTVENESAIHDRLRTAVGRSMGMFYADDGLIGLWDPEWPQGSTNVLIRLFCMIGLMINVEKSKTMAYQPGAIFTGVSEESFSRSITGKRSTYWERLQRRIQCLDCSAEFTAGYMKDHHTLLHGNYPEIDWDQLPVIQTEQFLLVYEVRLPTTMHL